MIDLDDMVNKVLNILGWKGCNEQSQVDFLDNGLGNLEESQLATKIYIGVDVVQDNPIVGNDANTIAMTPPILGSGIQSDPNPISTKLSTHGSGVPKAPQASKGHIENSLPNSGTRMSFVILPTQIINVKSTILPTQTPNASSIQIKSIKQKELGDVIDITFPRKNHVGCP